MVDWLTSKTVRMMATWKLSTRPNEDLPVEMAEYPNTLRLSGAEGNNAVLLNAQGRGGRASPFLVSCIPSNR